MREIKFRQAILKNDKFDQWNYWGFVEYRGEFRGPITIQGLANIYKVTQSEQYTGITDKNDKEVYEGDIIERSTGYRQVIGLIQMRQCYSAPPTSRTFWTYDIIEDEDKVIGNIHQNPDLLENPK